MNRVKINLEFIFRASPAILYQFFTNPSTLILWFCDEVDISNETYTFYWDGAEEVAELVEDHENELLRFEFEDYEDGEYLEFRIKRSPVTGETILEITDFCDKEDVKDQSQLWENKINLAESKSSSNSKLNSYLSSDSSNRALVKGHRNMMENKLTRRFKGSSQKLL